MRFENLTAGETGSAILARLTKAGLKIEPDAHKALIELLDGSVGALDSELAKLVNFKAPGEPITLEDIDQVVSGSHSLTVFELGDRVAEGNGTLALEQIRQYLDRGESPTGLLYFLGLHFISLYLAKNGKLLDPRRPDLYLRV